MKANIVSPDLEEMKVLLIQALDENGILKVMPKSFYAQFQQASLSAFCLRMGCYALPTVELLNLINEKIMDVSPSRNAIEIGSGNGVLGKNLGITCTDNFIQHRPEVMAYYEKLQQPIAPYGKHVVKLDAESAVIHYKPDVVVAAWVTHIYSDADPERGGNMFGVDELSMLERIKRYVFVANLTVHHSKPLMEKAHEIIQGDFLFSRSLTSNACALLIWKGGKA